MVDMVSAAVFILIVAFAVYAGWWLVTKSPIRMQ